MKTFLLLLLCLLNMPALASESSLATAYANTGARLEHNPFGRELYLDSREASNGLNGEIHARIAHSYADVRAALAEPARWCELLLLPFNVKNCAATGAQISLNIGRKFDQPLADTHALTFRYEPRQASDKYLLVELRADEGPMGTRDYRIQFEAMPVEGGAKTFLHLSYSYAYGWSGRLAAQAYFATSGRAKIGFTQIAPTDGGEPQPVGGLRGAIERNAMRYFLAIEAYLAHWKLPREQRVERSLAYWFDATGRYPSQLHEMERAEYIDMKRREFARQAQNQAGVAISS